MQVFKALKGYMFGGPPTIPVIFHPVILKFARMFEPLLYQLLLHAMTRQIYTDKRSFACCQICKWCMVRPNGGGSLNVSPGQQKSHAKPSDA